MSDLALEVHVSRWEFQCKCNLAGSDGENMTLAQLLALAGDADRADFDEISLGDTQTWGAPVLRSEIARTYEGR